MLRGKGELQRSRCLATARRSRQWGVISLGFGSSILICKILVATITTGPFVPVVSTFVSEQLSQNFKDICSLERLAKAADSGP